MYFGWIIHRYIINEIVQVRTQIYPSLTFFLHVFEFFGKEFFSIGSF